jgi:hypothetical protein
LALDAPAMKSVLGLLAALCAAALFAVAYYVAVRPGAGWLDSQWVFLAALPYNWTLLHVTGASNFSPDAPGQVAGAALFDVILAFVAGALFEAAARGLSRWAARIRARA